MAAKAGIRGKRIQDSPVAIIDFETTGLTAGVDRVVEVSVVRVDPGAEPKLVFDTLVNPLRRVSATEIHGITDADVADAPRFQDIAGDVVNAISGCVLASYNVYFDIKFLAFELKQAGVDHSPPHFCLMYMRPMLGLGSRCKLADACRAHDIEHESSHVAACDALACAKLWKRYFELLDDRKVSTFAELEKLKPYKFLKSFENDPIPDCSTFRLAPSGRTCSRFVRAALPTVDPLQVAIREYWDTLKTVVADLDISPDELEYVQRERSRLGLKAGQIRVLHARAFASAIVQFIDDQWLDDREVLKLRRLHECLAQLGWAPGA